MNDTAVSFNPTLLRLARERAGLTQRALMERAGLTQAVISKYESGQIVPSPSALERMASVLGVLPGFFGQTYTETSSGLPHHRKFASLAAKIRHRIEAEAKLRIRDAVALLAATGRSSDWEAAPEMEWF